MDILDIDEALKDDSFIFMEEKTHDDISNILQQWRSSNNLAMQSNVRKASQRDAGYQLDSRTFTRPKRKLQNVGLHMSTNGHHSYSGTPTVNMEAGGLLTTNMQKSFLQDTSPPSFTSIDMSLDRINDSMITSADFTNLNFLEPHNSTDHNWPISSHNLCNASIKVANNLSYTLNDMIRDKKALESLTISGDGSFLVKDTQIAQIDNISLAQNKTASGCSTMDNSIEGVDAMNSTIQQLNNIESSEKNEKNTKNGKNEMPERKTHPPFLNATSRKGILHRTVILSSDNSDMLITSNLFENRAQTKTNDDMLNVTERLGENISLENGKEANTAFDRSISMTLNARCETPENIERDLLTTMKYCQSTPQANSIQHNKQNFTPTLHMIEDVDLSPISVTISQTKPITIRSQQRYSLQSPNDNSNNINHYHHRNDNNHNDDSNVYENYHGNCDVNRFSENLKHLCRKMDISDRIDDSNDICNRSYTYSCNELNAAAHETNANTNLTYSPRSSEKLLNVNNNEEEFDQILNEFAKVEMGRKQVRINKSLETLKKRFKYGINCDKSQKMTLLNDDKDNIINKRHTHVQSDDVSEACLNNPNHIFDVLERLDDSQEYLAKATHCKQNTESVDNDLNTSATSSATSTSVCNGNNERLLSRRCRLYDDVNLPTGNTLSANGQQEVKATISSTSFTVRQFDNESRFVDIQHVEGEDKHRSNEMQIINENSHAANSSVTYDSSSKHKMPEKCERDRDWHRSKTIKINKTCVDKAGSIIQIELNVPCIGDDDDDYGDANVNLNESNNNNNRDDDESIYDNENNIANSAISAPTQHLSQNSQLQQTFVAPKEEINTILCKLITTNTNYLTYKKPKAGQPNIFNLPDVATMAIENKHTKRVPKVINAPRTRLEYRSLSRPRNLSGIHKINTVNMNKAASSDELVKTPLYSSSSSSSSPSMAASSQCILQESKDSTNVTFCQKLKIDGKVSDKATNDLKSPLGTKSKSYSNLSTNIPFSSVAVAKIGNGSGSRGDPQAIHKTFGVKKRNQNTPNTTANALAKAITNRTTLASTGNIQQSLNNTAQQKKDIFKAPKGGVRTATSNAPGGSSAINANNGNNCMKTKYSTLVRPSSGYYSLNAAGKSGQAMTTVIDHDSDIERQSPTDSTSSASSKGSVAGLNKMFTRTKYVTIETPSTSYTRVAKQATNVGIPKPSGLKPPTVIKRSALSRPAATVKTVK